MTIATMFQFLVTGHYVCDAYDFLEKAWRSYDDTRVTSMKEEDVLSNRATTGYIFFYAAKYACCFCCVFFRKAWNPFHCLWQPNIRRAHKHVSLYPGNWYSSWRSNCSRKATSRDVWRRISKSSISGRFRSEQAQPPSGHASFSSCRQTQSRLVLPVRSFPIRSLFLFWFSLPFFPLV